MFQFKRHSRRAGLYGLELRIIVGDAFGKNADRLAALEHLETGLERLHDGTHRAGIILQAIDRNDAALLQEPGERWKAKQPHGRYKVDLTRDQRANDKR